jgi:hypothetical protein
VIVLGAALLLVGLGLLVVAPAVLAVAQALMEARSYSCVRIGMHASPQDRAEALLRDLLDESEYRQLTRRGYLEITSPSDEQRVYRIPRCVGLVNVYEHGRRVRQLCVQPVEPLPGDDVMVLHKLMILANEEEYLACAHQFPIAAPCDASASGFRTPPGRRWSGGPRTFTSHSTAS